MSAKPTPGRTGRPPTADDKRYSRYVNFRVTAAQHAKLQELGGNAWLRNLLQRRVAFDQKIQSGKMRRAHVKRARPKAREVIPDAVQRTLTKRAK